MRKATQIPGTEKAQAGVKSDLSNVALEQKKMIPLRDKLNVSPQRQDQPDDNNTVVVNFTALPDTTKSLLEKIREMKKWNDWKTELNTLMTRDPVGFTIFSLLCKKQIDINDFKEVLAYIKSVLSKSEYKNLFFDYLLIEDNYFYTALLNILKNGDTEKFFELIHVWPISRLNSDPELLKMFQKFLTPYNDKGFGPLETLFYSGTKGEPSNSTKLHRMKKRAALGIFIKFNELARIAFKDAKVDLDGLNPLNVDEPYVDSNNSNQPPMNNFPLLHKWVSIDGFTGFHTACRSNLFEIVSKYLDPKFYSVADSKDEKEIAHIVIRFLLLKPSVKGYSPLISSCQLGIDYKIFQAIFHVGKKYLGIYTPLFKSFLLQRTKDRHLTAFHYACRRGDFKRVNDLLKVAKEIDAKNNNHELMEALFLNTSEVDQKLEDPINGAAVYQSIVNWLKHEVRTLYPTASQTFRSHIIKFQHFNSEELAILNKQAYELTQTQNDERAHIVTQHGQMQNLTQFNPTFFFSNSPFLIQVSMQQQFALTPANTFIPVQYQEQIVYLPVFYYQNSNDTATPVSTPISYQQQPLQEYKQEISNPLPTHANNCHSMFHLQANLQSHQELSLTKGLSPYGPNQRVSWRESPKR